MFKLDCTFEDLRMDCRSDDGSAYTCHLSDGHSGKTGTLELTPSQLSVVLQMNLSPEGELETEELTKQAYNDLEPLISHLPLELRPIP